ncbi:MAG: hypothetical protein EOO27_28700 [Comamonadaceae bacterium]|nr:MAG: hypothetical protein EOO27_28700 [Comamonadaceae bacterium]
MTIYVGSEAIGEVYVGSEKMAEAWVWNGTAWEQLLSQTASFVDMRATVASDTTVTTGGGRVIFTNWAADAEYPGTSFSGGKFTMGGDGLVRVLVTCNISGYNQGVKFFLMKNGTEIGTVKIQYESENPRTIDVWIDAVNGDEVWLEVDDEWGWDGVVDTETSILFDVDPAFPLTLTPVFSDNFDAQADGDLAQSSNGWDYISTLSEPQVYVEGGGKAVRGEFAAPSSRPNCRSSTETNPATSQVGTYAKANILSIGERAGIWLAGGVTAYFTSPTTIEVGTLSGSSSGYTPTVLETITVPAVSLPAELLIASTSSTNVDIYLDGVKVGYATHSFNGNSAGILLSSTTDALDDFACGTFTS